MPYLIISSSLNPASRSRVLAMRAAELMREAGAPIEYIDLRTLDLPSCDGDGCYNDPGVQALGKKIAGADGILLATPIYNYGVSASAKNLVELTGSAWTRKLVGFLCAAGGPSSYMAAMGLANSLMLDFRSIILPRFVYASETAFERDEIVDTAVVDRLRDLTATLVKFSAALRNAGAIE
jgi:FMN reductase